MKAITLTEKHKSKLIEICKALFPEYSSIIFNDDYKQLEGNNEEDNPNLLIFYQGVGKNGIEIHWFEFCIKHLIIAMIKDDIMEIETTRSLFCSLPNPVDYLYDKFLKLKK